MFIAFDSNVVEKQAAGIVHLFASLPQTRTVLNGELWVLTQRTLGLNESVFWAPIGSLSSPAARNDNFNYAALGAIWAFGVVLGPCRTRIWGEARFGRTVSVTCGHLPNVFIRKRADQLQGDVRSRFIRKTYRDLSQYLLNEGWQSS